MIFGAILAGGTGVRMDKHNIPKQFIELCGKPIIVRTIERMLEAEEFDYIYIAINSNYKDDLINILERCNLGGCPKIIIIDGGKERIDSVQNVINAVYEHNHDENDIIVLHDAVRPFVSKRVLLDSIHAASKYGACVAAVPAIDTVYEAKDTVITGFPNRKFLVNGQSPDSFRLGVIKSAIEGLTDDERKVITGTVQICAAKGYTVKTTVGDYKNIKITTENDLLIAEQYIKEDMKSESMCIEK